MFALASMTFALLAGTTAIATPSGAPKLGYVANLDYSNGAISVFSVANGKATLVHRFVPVNPKDGSANGIQVRRGMIYTAINSSTGKPCTSCLEVFSLDGKLVSSVNAPTLSGAPGGPQITDLSLDGHGDVFLSDYGQQAVYYFTPSAGGWSGPNIVVQGTQNAASVAVTPNAQYAYISGGCGFASARVYTRLASGGYQSGNCFGIGTIALIGASVNAGGDVASPVDGAPGLVSIGNPDGKGMSFTIPDFKDGIGSVAFARNDMVLYVVDSTKEVVYAYRRPDGGWLTRKPHLIATYTGFKALDIVATMR
jgi:hypothetical protein